MLLLKEPYTKKLFKEIQMKPIKVLIVEDSKLMQEILSKILLSDPEIKIVGTAADPLIARELIKLHNPDVLTLDIMLPHMDGITFLKNLMRLHPLPVVMISTLTEKGSALALEALANGAVDYLAKPTQKQLDDLATYATELITAVKNAAQTNVAKNTAPFTSTEKNLRNVVYQSDMLKDKLIAIGASTGGIEAIETILLQLPQVLPPVIIVQHMKKEFSSAFSKRIRKLYGLSVIEPENYTEILPGNIYIAPASYHLIIKKQKNGFVTLLDDSPPVNGHKPSINMLFQSVAESIRYNGIGILLTGMGSDGAEGLKKIRDAGGATIVQDEASSVVWGMPGAAVKINAAEHVVSLNKIPQKILQIIDIKTLGIKAL